MKKRILVIEDDPSISEMIQSYLTQEGYHIECAFDGIEALKKFKESPVDLIILDIMLPRLDGMEFLKKAREQSTLPVLIVSAKDTDVDKALGLGFGADDYLAKPFSMIELGARVKAAIRRAHDYTKQPEPNSSIVRGDLELDLRTFSIRKQGASIKLTAKEFEIIKLFFENPDRVFTKKQIYTFIWNEDYYGEENVINVHIRRLREKIEDDPSEPKIVVTVWGIGYKLGEQ